MKNKIQISKKLLSLLALAGFGFFSSVNGQVIRTFTQRASSATPTKLIYNIKGDYSMIGNTNLTLDVYGDNTNNSNNSMRYVDVDADANTLNSSSATLALSTENGAIPSCSRILYAGLYWTGRASNAATSPESFTVTKGSVTKNFNKRTVSLKGPGQSNYTQLVANPGNIYYPVNGDGFMYSAYIEVTDYVKANGLGEYTVADIALIEGNGGATGYYGGWGMIVVYENSKMNWRDVTIFDGHAYVTGNATLNFELPVSGFHTAQSGPVNLKLGLMAGEGDVGISGDYFKIRNHTDNAWVTLSHSGNTTTNFFNGSVNTGGNPRNPMLQNNTGLDMASFYIPNPANSVITNNQTSTKFQYGSTQDTYIIFCIAMAVDAYVPDVEMFVSAQSINGQPVGSGPLTVQPGQDIEYKLEVKNLGTEAVDNVKFTLPIPYPATYVAGSATTTVNFVPPPVPNNFYFDPAMGPTGSVVWDMGTLPLPPIGFPDSVLAVLTFHFTVTTNCYILKNPDCPPSVTLAGGVISGTGAISGASFSNVPIIQGFQTSGGCIGEPITDPLKIDIDAGAYLALNCQNVTANKAFVFCNYTAPTIPIDSIAPAFPVGLKFYNTNNVTPSSIEYDANNPFPATPGTHTYFAIPVGINFCYYTFTIAVSDITSVPLTNDLIYCLNDPALPLTATTSDPSYTLFFYNSLTSTSPQFTVTPSTAAPGVTTWYVAEGDLATCVSPNRDSIQVTVYDVITASVNTLSQVNVLCKGGNTGSVSAVASGSNGMFSYLWNTTPAQTTVTATGLTAGIYSVTVSSNIGCSVPATAVATITEPSLALASSITAQSAVLCKGGSTGSATASASGGSLSYAYLWNTTPTQTTAVATGLSAGSYTVTVTDNNGCVVPATATVSVSEPAAVLTSVVIPVSYNGQGVSCSGANDGSIDLQVSGGTVAYTYVWSSSATTQDISGLSAGNYSVLITDANGCSTFNSVTLTEPAILSSAILSTSNYNGQNISCNGLSNGSIDLGASGGTGTYTYSWSNSSTTQDITGLIAGTYSVLVTDVNGCTASSSVTLSQPLALISTASVTSAYNGQNISCHGMNDGSIGLSVSGGTANYTYNWSNNASTQNISSLAAGNYFVLVIDANGCISTTSLTLTEPSQFQITDAVTNVTCSGYSNGAVDISPAGGTPGYIYSWSNGATTQDISGVAAGQYTVTLVDANGCSTMSSNSVYEDAKLDVAITFIDVSCNGLSDGQVSVMVSGGVAPYQYSWSNGATSQGVAGLSAGTYFISVTDSNSCVISDTMTISEPQILAATLQASTYAQGYNVSWLNAYDGFIDLSVTGGTAPYNFFWSAGSTTEDLSNLPAGTYTVQITDVNGCIVFASVELTGPQVLQMPSAYTPNSDGKNDFFVVHGLDMYPENEITVFNRWGNIVYRQADYKNDWNGQSNNGNSLPDATYFVILKIVGYDIVLQGYVDLRR